LNFSLCFAAKSRATKKGSILECKMSEIEKKMMEKREKRIERMGEN